MGDTETFVGLISIGAAGAAVAAIFAAVCGVLLFYPLHRICSSNIALRMTHFFCGGLGLGLALALIWLGLSDRQSVTPTIYLALEATLLILAGMVAGLVFYKGAGLDDHRDGRKGPSEQ